MANYTKYERQYARASRIVEISMWGMMLLSGVIFSSGFFSRKIPEAVNKHDNLSYAASTLKNVKCYDERDTQIANIVKRLETDVASIEATPEYTDFLEDLESRRRLDSLGLASIAVGSGIAFPIFLVLNRKRRKYSELAHSNPQ